MESDGGFGITKTLLGGISKMPSSLLKRHGLSDFPRLDALRDQYGTMPSAIVHPDIYLHTCPKLVSWRTNYRERLIADRGDEACS
jgi:hypothetical protein